MKNKHLVLIFLVVLLAGLLLRHVPWCCKASVQSPLLKAPVEAVYRIYIRRPGQPDFLLEHSATGWMAEQGGRTLPVPTDTALVWVRLLAQPFSLTPLSEEDAAAALEMSSFLRLEVLAHHRPPLILEIGQETTGPDGVHTIIRFPQHKGIYRASGALRTPFDRTLDDFRHRQVLSFPLVNLCRLELRWSADSSVSLEKNDSLGWRVIDGKRVEMARASVPYWLNAVEQLGNLPFADFFDESLETHSLLLTAIFTACDGQTFTLRLFELHPSDMPEDVGLLLSQGIRIPPRYALHSSANPHNYFVLVDAALGGRIAQGPQAF